MVPFPHAVDDHQTSNALYLVESGAAFLVQQKELTVATLAGIISGLGRDECLSMAVKAKTLGKPNATADVAKICMEVAL